MNTAAYSCTYWVRLRFRVRSILAITAACRILGSTWIIDGLDEKQKEEDD